MTSAFIVFVGSLLISLLFTASIRSLAIRYGFIADPQDDRWHKVPTAQFGGVGIYLGYLLPLLFFAGEFPLLQLLLFGAFLICGMGLIDDYFHLDPSTKLIGQIVVACLFVSGGQFLEIFNWSIFTFVLALFWIVGVTNAFNLLDNMDGLCAGTACIAAFYLLLAGMISKNYLIVLACASLVGTTLGFLWFNFYPAKIFMGDSGSLFLGFTLSTLSVTGLWENVTNVLFALLIPVLVLAVPIFDTAFVSLVRFFNNRPISQGGRDHTSHRLVAFGLPERTVVLLFYALSLICGSFAVIGLAYDWVYPAILTVLIAIVLLYFGIFLSGVVTYGNKVKHIDGKNSKLTLNLFLMEKKRIGEILLDAILIAFSFILAFIIRFDGLPQVYAEVVVQTLPLLIPLKLGIFFYCGLYRGLWRYIGMQDLFNIIKAVSLSSVVSVAFMTIIFRFQDYSRAVFFIDMMILFLAVGGVRVAIRAMNEYFGSFVKEDGKRVLIMGAGDAGEMALREFRNNSSLQYLPVGFIDDDNQKVGRNIHGVPVLGTRAEIADLVKKYKIEEILVAIPSADQESLKNIFRDCKNTGVLVQVLSKPARGVTALFF